MNCKFCDALLEEGVTLCPQCGKENAESAEEVMEIPEEITEEIPEETTEEVTEETAEEATEEVSEETEESEESEETVEETAQEQPKKKRKLWVSILAIVLVLALAATLVGAVIYGTKASKGAASYTVSEAKAIKERRTVVAKVGDVELTNSELQVYFWQSVSEFYDYYGYYMDLSTIGLDLNKPLDQQYYDEANGVTWQAYFLETALNTWHRYATLSLLGKEAGFELDAETLAYLEDIPNQLEEMAVMYGYADAATMLSEDMSPACDVEGYLSFIKLNLYVSQYFDSVYTTLEPTQAEVEAYYDANTETVTGMGIVKDDSKYVDVRHILVNPVSAEDTETFTEAEWETCRQKAQALLDLWLAGDKSEESFALLAMEHSEDAGSQTEGGLYTNVTQGTMTEAFDAWCFDPARQHGDYGLVKTDYGYHIMYFVDSRLIWVSDLTNHLTSQRSTEMVDTALKSHPMDVNLKKVVLGVATAAEETETTPVG